MSTKLAIPRWALAWLSWSDRPLALAVTLPASFVEGVNTAPPILILASVGEKAGKTEVIRALMKRAYALGGHPSAIKPIEVGCAYDERSNIIGADGERLRQERQGMLPPLVASPYRFSSPKNPVEAAEATGLVLGEAELNQAIATAREFGDVLFVEGCGQWDTAWVPGQTAAHFAHQLGGQLLLVVKKGAEAELSGALEAAQKLGLAPAVLYNLGAEAAEDGEKVYSAADFSCPPEERLLQALGAEPNTPTQIAQALETQKVLEGIFKNEA